MSDVTLTVEPQDIASIHVGKRASGEAALQLTGVGLVVTVDLTPGQARDLVDKLLTVAVAW